MKYRKFKIFFIMFIFLIPGIDLFCADIDTVLNDIENNMKNVKTVQAKFVQIKKMAMFDMPVTIKGKLYIENPDMFAWMVIEPIEYTLIITDDTVKKWDPSTGVHKLSLNENPMFKAMIEQITFWFSGSYASCKKDYHIKSISNDNESVILNFTPKMHNQASEMLSSITLVFQNNKKYI
ncbi:MAG: outer membrane lipoprotein carrier protein LolA, partial [Desulfobacteraceae bacterium]|nr:outer membrane lipoprotein carrier protein LolA [Desulfobacteraceae bacterium]